MSIVNISVSQEL